MVRRFTIVILLFAVLLAASAVALAQDVTPESTPEAETTEVPAATPIPPEILVPQVIEVYPHDTAAYTQGLLLDNGQLYESTGQRGESTLRLVNLETGEAVQQVSVDDAYFAEGLALVDDRLIQLTWQAGIAFVYDKDTFEQVGTFDYEGEGWGLCYDGESLYMSDGTDTLTQRNPETFEVLNTLVVTYLGDPVSEYAFRGQRIDLLNEMECVGDSIYVNVWQTNLIYRIDKSTGAITGLIDASQLLTQEEFIEVLTASSNNVLNGIAYDVENDQFLLTGKRWPKLFRVVFVPYEGQ
ncbi:MAG: glutaminyl-peptide cyclotransferase [Anaerolineaceae bacterium]|nr:glutaminyl-peptide cyclotransferase [Anaerolineaceae bacterium]